MLTYGEPNAPLLVLGEFPALATGSKPFMGEAGTLLDTTLQRAGLAGSCLFVHVTRLHTLESEHLELLRGRSLVLALGEAALRCCTGDMAARASTLRGQVCATLAGVPVLATLDPGTVAYAPKLYRSFVADLQQARRLVAGPPALQETRMQVVADHEDARAVVETLLESPLLAADIETTGLDWTRDRLLVVGFCAAPGQSYLFPAALLEATRPLYERVPMVWHNGKFDTKFLRRAGYPARVSHDSLLLHYCLDENPGGHGLKQLAAELLGAGNYEAELDAYKEEHDIRGDYGRIPAEVLYPYLARDVDYTLRLYRLLFPRVQESPSLLALYTRLLIPAVQTLLEVEERGIWVDRDRLDEADAVLTERQRTARAALEVQISGHWDYWTYAAAKNEDKVREQFARQRAREEQRFAKRRALAEENLARQQKNERMIALWAHKRRSASSQAALDMLPLPRVLEMKKVPEPVGALKELPFNPNSYQQVGWLLGEMGHRVHSTAEEVLLPLAESVPMVRTLLSYRKATKALGTYVHAIRKSLHPDDRIRATFNLASTVTGRLSSSDPINLQNIPRDPLLRGIFGAPPGKLLISADYSQAELRTLAHFSGDLFLQKVYADGRDLHSEVASALFGAQYTKEQRTIAKTINFGIAYGLSARGLSEQLGLSLEDAQRMVTGWYARMPRAQAYLESCKAAPLAGRVLVTPFGRHRRYGLVNRQNVDAVQREASNLPIQSTASDLTLLAAVVVSRQLPPGAGIVNLVHDALLVECLEEDAPRVARLVLETMREVPARALRASVPFDADAEYGRHWAVGAVKFAEKDEAPTLVGAVHS